MKGNVQNAIIMAGFALSIASFAHSAGAAAFARDLYSGMRTSQEVRELQEFLKNQGMYAGPITGNFFSLTAQAVVAFQRREGITPASGYVGPKTRARVNEIIAKATTPESPGGVPGAASGIQIEATASQSSIQTVEINNAALKSQIDNLLQQVNLLQSKVQEQRPSAPQSSGAGNVVISSGQTMQISAPAAQNSPSPSPSATTANSSSTLLSPTFQVTNLIQAY